MVHWFSTKERGLTVSVWNTAHNIGGALVANLALLGVTLSLTALLFVQAGVAASITAFAPVLTILISARFHHEPLTPGTILGALVAATGIVFSSSVATNQAPPHLRRR